MGAQVRVRGKPKEMGLGSASSVPLADAREKAATARRKIAHGINPIEERKRDSGIPTFGAVADEVRQSLSKGFRNEKSYRQILVTAEPVRRRRLRADDQPAWR